MNNHDLHLLNRRKNIWLLLYLFVDWFNYCILWLPDCGFGNLRLSRRWGRITLKNWLSWGEHRQSNGKSFFDLMPKEGYNRRAKKSPLWVLVVMENPAMMGMLTLQVMLTPLEPLIYQLIWGAGTQTPWMIMVLQGLMTLMATSSARGTRITGKHMVNTNWCIRLVGKSRFGSCSDVHCLIHYFNAWILWFYN